MIFILSSSIFKLMGRHILVVAFLYSLHGLRRREKVILLYGFTECIAEAMNL